MADVSISKALRIPKVSTAFAPNAESERFQDPRFSVCPAWNSQDNLGRNVSYFSFNSLTAGCHDPMQRIVVENFLRPSYHPYLNAQGISEDEYSFGSSFGGYDTAGVRRDEAYHNYGDYQIPGPTKDLGSYMSPTATSFEFQRERDRQNRALRRVFEYNRYQNSGM